MTDTLPDPESCYRAVCARDARFDGLFFTAVTTTRIYCRSVCPARTPRRSSCRFYATAAQAERDGFRPCLRCRPELAPGRPATAASLGEAVLARVQAWAHEEGSLESLARSVGLTRRHLRRVLSDQFGVTPLAVVQTQRLLFSKKLLHETRLPITQVAQASGFGSVRRFNALFRERYRMSPTMLRRASGTELGVDDLLTLRLAYRPPLAWDAALSYLAARATPCVEVVDQGAYWRTVTLSSGGALVSGWIRVDAPDGKSQLRVAVPARLYGVLLPLSLRLRAIFDLDADLEQIDRQLGVDPALRRLVAQTPGLRVLGSWDPFELALRAVLGQQVSVAGATTLAGRFAERFGEVIDTPSAQLCRLAPTAERIAQSTPEEVASLGLPRARSHTVVALARFAARGGLMVKPGTPLEEVVARLSDLPGIGGWTAQYVAMRAYRYPDAFPAGDLGLKRALPRAEPERHQAGPTSEKDLLARSHAWKPWRAYAAWHLWNCGH